MSGELFGTDADMIPASGTFNPYADEEALGIERDQWDRPLIKPDPLWLENPTPGRKRLVQESGWPDGKVPKHQRADGRRPYARASSLGSGIDPAYGLGVWLRRHALLAVARRPDLVEALQTMTYLDGKLIDEIADEALIRAKDDMSTHRQRAGTTKALRDVFVNRLIAAQRGTTFHRLTTPDIAAGLMHQAVHGPALLDYRVAADSLAEALEKAELEVVETEQFVVNDDLGSAGTYDHLYRDLRTGNVHVGDKKSGELYWTSFVAQVETYSGAKHYDPETGDRSPLHPDLDPSLGFIMHTDLRTGQTVVYEVDLDGEMARLAVQVWKANKADWIKARMRKRV